jgi:hypothetical protein
MAASAALQARYYAREHDFGVFFETGRMADIAQFLARCAERDGAWVVVDGGEVLGTIVIDGGANDDPTCAQLRWFIMADALRGRSFGRRMMTVAMDLPLPLRAGAARHVRRTGRRTPSIRRPSAPQGTKPDDEVGPRVLEQHWEWTT